MICPYCQAQSISLARSYNIQNVKERFIPTYYHTQIFAPIEANPSIKIRCTPTFHSQIFRSEANNLIRKNTIYKTNYNRPKSSRQTIYKNCSRGKKQDHFYNSRGNCNYRSKQLWYDSSKQDLFKKLQECGQRGYPHQRKQIDLSSNPVFGGSTLHFYNCHQKNVNPQIEPENNQKFLQKEAQDGQDKQLKGQQIIKHVKDQIQQLQQDNQPQLTKSTPSNQQNKKNQQKITKKTNLPKEKALKKTAFNKKIVEGSPCFTVVRKRNW